MEEIRSQKTEVRSQKTKPRSWKLPRRNDISKIMRVSGISAVILFIGTATVSACVIDYPRYKVQSSFWVKTYHDGKPISGVEISLYRGHLGKLERPPLLVSTSGKDGIIKIEHLPVGKYFVSVTTPGGGDAAELVVDAEETSDSRNEIGLSWPFFNSTVKTKHLAGVLWNGNELMNSQVTALKNAQLELWKLGGKGPIDFGVSDNNGRFNLNANRPGLYILRVRGGAPYFSSKGDIPFEILDPRSEGPDFVPLYLEMTSCGLHVTLESHASQK